MYAKINMNIYIYVLSVMNIAKRTFLQGYTYNALIITISIHILLHAVVTMYIYQT